MARKMLMLIISISLSGCGHFAQTPEEWVYYHKQGKTMRGTKTVEIPRPLSTVIANLNEYASKCVNGMIMETSLTQGMYYERNRTTYTAKVKPSENGLSLLSIQIMADNAPRQKEMAAGGDFFFVSEIQGGKSKTTITSYYLVMSKHFADQVSEWANGIKKQCPKENR